MGPGGLCRQPGEGARLEHGGRRRPGLEEATLGEQLAHEARVGSVGRGALLAVPWVAVPSGPWPLSTVRQALCDVVVSAHTRRRFQRTQGGARSAGASAETRASRQRVGFEIFHSARKHGLRRSSLLGPSASTPRRLLCPLLAPPERLRIRRLGVRVPPSALHKPRSGVLSSFTGFRACPMRAQLVGSSSPGRLVEPDGERVVERGEQVAVAVQRDGDRAVPEAFHDGLRMPALCDQQAGTRVSLMRTSE